MNDWSARAIRRSIRDGQTITVRLEGTSMHPLLQSGTRVRLVPVASLELRVGAVVAIPVGDAIAVHRIVMLRDQVLQTQGDAAIAADAPIGRKDIIAIASSFEARPGLWLPMWSNRLAHVLLLRARRR